MSSYQGLSVHRMLGSMQHILPRNVHYSYAIQGILIAAVQGLAVWRKLKQMRGMTDRLPGM